MNTQAHAFGGSGGGRHQSLSPFYVNSCKCYASPAPGSVPAPSLPEAGGALAAAAPFDAAHPLPIRAAISANGAAVETPAAYASLVLGQGQDTFYEVLGFDSQVVNPRFALALPGGTAPAALLALDRAAARCSVLVQVAGRVRFKKAAAAGGEEDTKLVNGGGGAEHHGDPMSKIDDGSEKFFNEVFVLVPNWDAVLGRNPPKGLRKWVIMSQNYRAM